MDAIKGFQGEYRWLSNFYPCQIEYKGLVYPSTENAYQAMKFDIANRSKFTLCSAAVAKKLGSTKPIETPDWEIIKYLIMWEVNCLKYEIPSFREKLLATGDAYIEETNNWGDTNWGVCNGVGNNHLGHILMGIRQDIVDAVTT